MTVAGGALVTWTAAVSRESSGARGLAASLPAPNPQSRTATPARTSSPPAAGSVEWVRSACPEMARTKGASRVTQAWTFT